MGGLFDIKHKPSVNLSLDEQRRQWMPQFLKAFSVVFLAYFTSYLIRQNMQSANVAMKKTLGMNKHQIGHIMAAFSLTYGLGKTAIGFLVDRKNSKRILSFLIILGGIFNIGIGILYYTDLGVNSLIIWTMILWAMNGLVLSPGGPCSYSTIMRWMPKSRQSTWLGRWNISHNVGGAFAALSAGKIASTFFKGSVGGFFIVPGVFAIFVGIWGIFFAKDDPKELGWNCAADVWGEPEEEIEHEGENGEGSISRKEIFFKYVLRNKWLLLLAFANIFVYIIRMGIVSWIVFYSDVILEHKLDSSAGLMIYFEISALVGSIFLGWFTDKIKGRRMLVSGVMMLLTSVGIYFYSIARSVSGLALAMCICGLLIFGPQLLIGVSVVKFVPKKAVAVANGLTGTAAYLVGDLLAKEGLPKFINRDTRCGWQKMFIIMYISVICGAIIMFIVAVVEEKQIRADEARKKEQNSKPLERILIS